MFRICRILNVTKIWRTTVKQVVTANTHATRNSNRLCNGLPQNKLRNVVYAGLLTWLGFTKDDADKESELIMTIKRSILLMQRDELAKAERMLHLALKLAQEQQSPDGVTYVYDLLANLALEQGAYDKAEKLFVSVLQRLLSQGVQQDDIKVIHISLKLARICHMKRELDKADVGFEWCLERVRALQAPDNPEARLLYGVVQDWRAQLLLDGGRARDAVRALQEAHSVCVEVDGAASQKAVLLLNDLAAAHLQLGEAERAHDLLARAVALGAQLADFERHQAVLLANLGLACARRGLPEDARRHCTRALALARRGDHQEAAEQALHCLRAAEGGARAAHAPPPA